MTPHKDKLEAALHNIKAVADYEILMEALDAYNAWIASLRAIQATGDGYLREAVRLLNEYKDFLEVELIASRGSDFIKRQKGQMKLDNSIIEEFLPYLITPKLLRGLPTDFQLETGARTSFMSLCFRPSNIDSLIKPEIVVKEKDQDFTIGKSYFYKFSSTEDFNSETTTYGRLFLAVLAAECKVNYDKTMFQECAGTAARLKQGCPIAKYFVLVEYLDMQPEDTRLTNIDNVFLLRKTKRLPYDKRNSVEYIRRQHQDSPISYEVMKKFVDEIQNFIDATWYDPNTALERGSFV